MAWKLDPNYFSNLFVYDYSGNQEYISGNKSFMDLATPNISLIIFWGAGIILAIFAFLRKYSLIPLMGVITCMYLLTGMTKANWLWFLAWLLLGVCIYFSYSYRRSKLAPPQA